MIKQYQEKPLRDLTFAIVGLGLIGGSYAKALRNIKVRKILGMDISHGIARACLNANMIDEVIEADGSNLKEADVIICSVYPEAIVGFVRQNVQNFAEGMLMTDATGVKGTMPHDIQALLPESCEFISGHPMAGRQGSGLGFHFKCNILCDDKEFFWVNSDAVGTGELVDLLDEWAQLTDEPGYAGADRDGKRAWVREALKSGRLVATGDAVALVPQEE